jgi:LAO/AO transport system kinase
MRPFYVYILRCADGSYYVGHTDDMRRRMLQHENGEVGYTALRKPVELMWQDEFETRDGALTFELQIKGWSRAKKEALMTGDWERVQELAQSQGKVASTHRLRQAQPERLGVSGTGDYQSGLGPGRLPPQDKATTTPTVQPEPVEGRAKPVQALLEGVLGQPGPVQRRALSKAITLLESTRADHRAQADELLTQLLPHTGKSFRLGISGVPGVGKSTFIEALGLYLIAQGHRVAVLTIDPSSTVSGGSILGDKTRMEHLSVHEKAYIRPSPSSGTLGGVAEKTREAMLVCEAAGYDVVIVETVGVGQSEIAVAGMTDMFVLMQLPNAGDDLQAIKKGVMEIADLVVINKADIDKNAATRAEAQITSSLRLLSQHGNPENAHHDETLWHPKVVQISALLGQGVDAFWAAITQFRQLQTANGRIGTRREKQALSWMWERIDAGLKLAFRQHPQVRELLPQMQADVAAGRIAASTAARNLLLAQSGQAPAAIK